MYPDNGQINLSVYFPIKFKLQNNKFGLRPFIIHSYTIFSSYYIKKIKKQKQIR